MDTPQQKRALRSNKAARAVRLKFPAGTRVTAEHPSNHGQMPVGTVVRHVPALTSQGGTLVVLWDSGTEGRHQPISLRVVPDEQEGS